MPLSLVFGATTNAAVMQGCRTNSSPCTCRPHNRVEEPMRRQNIQLLAAVRQGDVAARLEVGRHYLKGSDGFPKHVPTGIDYLSHASVKGLTRAAQIIVDCLPLEELLSLQQAQAVDDAARAGSASAQVKLGAWCCTSSKRRAEGLRWLETAARAGHRGARLA